MGAAEEKLEKKIKGLWAARKDCLEARVSYGRGYKGITDQLLQDADNYESQARDLQRILDELREEA